MHGVVDSRSWHPLLDGCPPPWASAWGQDRYGPFVEFTIDRAVQRLRWIPAGSFRAGSPNDEPGRHADEEGPQHFVTISRGFWLGDTPCRQALWTAVMGDNPSRFPSPDRPVESVSWHDCQRFFQQAAACVPGLTLGLPTEAEWEYACRAGTTAATYAGPLELLGQHHAPALDAIAWYGGNCGVEFDLPAGAPAAWTEKQHVFDIGGTRGVALKQPNAWGLYDMLGNVFEWCRDGRRTYTARAELDPEGPAGAKDGRVLRGGSWYSVARFVRAASRRWGRPDVRLDFVGFRCRIPGPPRAL